MNNDAGDGCALGVLLGTVLWSLIGYAFYFYFST